MRIELDDQKYWINLNKHRIRFEEAYEIFHDMIALEMLDDSSGQMRFIRIGFNSARGILVVVNCERNEDLIRLISARRATKNEEGAYEERIRF